MLAADFNDVEVARQREQFANMAGYLRCLGAGLQTSLPNSDPAAILIAAADVLGWCNELFDPALIRSAAVSEARRSMAVADAEYMAKAREGKTISFTKPYWKLLKVMTEAALLSVRSDQARRNLLRVIRLAERKASPRPKKRAAKQPATLVVVRDTETE